LLVSSAALAQDFDPHGRHRPPQPPATGAHGPTAKPPSPAQPGNSPSQEALIERYAKVVLAQPGAPFPLQRLAQLYRERDGGIAKLITDFEARSGRTGPDQYASTVSLAGLYKLDGRTNDAVSTFEKAIALKPDDAVALLSLARLHQDRGDLAPARARFEQCLPLQTTQADKEQTLRTLMAIALDQKDWDGAKRFHRQLASLEPSSLFVKGELGRELFNRGEYDRAAAELKDVVAAAAGDNRALAPALKELGRAQAKAHDNQEALLTLKRALAAAGAQSALRAEIYEIVTEIYRADQKLPVLLKQLEDEHPNDFPRLALLAGLYEETGDSARAIATYKRALAIDPRQIDLRLRMIRLLQANGDLDAAIGEYEGLIRTAPNNPQFVFEECEALLQRGDRARALKLVMDLEARASADEEVLARVADFYARIGENDRSLKVLQRLAQTATGDAGHLVDLGDRYFQDGNQPLAVQTWRRILGVVQPRAKALAALGDVYLEHDMVADALAAYKEAVSLEPTNLVYKKSLAAAYERTRAYREARVIYEEIVAKAKEKGDKPLARECRTRIVALWGLERVLEQQIPGLRAAFGASSPDVEAGRMLAEAQLHLRKLADAEATLRRVLQVAPGDAESYLALERVLVQENKIGDAIVVLEKLALVDPKRARELYERMAQYALQIYKDDDAIKYAARAVELNPDDAEGHRRLGEMYRSRQDVDRAVAEFRAAIAKNDRLFVVYFELADLLLSKGQPDDADRLFRRVVRGAPDDELVARAARLAMQINLGKGTLESLEQELLPLAIGEPQRPIFRRLLVEIYGNLTFGLVQRVRHSSPEEAEQTRATLARIGARAVKPLLDALADSDATQQRIAIDVLAYVQNQNAALPLFAFATGPAEPALRARAMIACGALADAALVPKYESLLFPKEGAGDSPALAEGVAVAAVWGLARMHTPNALPLLRRIARSGAPGMRALAVLGLGMARDSASVRDIAAIASSPDAGNLARAAAAYALGDLDAQGEVPMLLEVAQESDALPRRMALVSLARMATARGKEPGWEHEAVQAMADAVFAGEQDAARARGLADAVSRTALVALSTLAGGGDWVGTKARARDRMPVPEGTLSIESLLDELVPRDVPAAERGAALVRFSDAIQRAALAALRTSGDRARAVLDALGTGDGGLEPFVSRDATGPPAAAARTLAAALEPSIVPLARHPDPVIRTKAIVLVARSSSDAAVDAIVAGLDDPSEAVQRVALAAVAMPRSDGARPPASARAVAAVGRALEAHESWALRVLAAQAMGRLGAAGAGPEASRRLAEAATRDAYALVRQAALESLAFFDAAAARTLATRMVTSDPEPLVREVARRTITRSNLLRGDYTPRIMKRAVALCIGIGCVGCRDLSSFTTGGDRFEGAVVQGDFVRAGVDKLTSLCLSLDTDHLQDAPGTISTSDGRFHASSLRSIPQIWHDPLSTLSFGDGRLKNLVYAAATSSPFGDGLGEYVMVVVSLMQSGDVEVRLIRGAPGLAAVDSGSPSGGNVFAVFDLTRQTGPCSL
jgi:tetratricopeptide (TPR) repeat protein